MGIMEKKMETTIVYWGLYGDYDSIQKDHANVTENRLRLWPSEGPNVRFSKSVISGKSCLSNANTD